ncbi:S1 family peptidase [Actinophytocola sediminis]
MFSNRHRTLIPVLALVGAVALPGQAQAVVGGTEVDEPLPWIASVQQPGGAHSCTASLVAPQWVLMAFHCTLAGPELQVRIGSLDRTRGGELVAAAELHPHPTAWYDQDTHAFGGVDLALVKLDHPVTAQPVGLAAESPAAGSPLRSLGWGYTCDEGCPLPERLHEFALPVDPDTCDREDRELLCVRDQDRGASAGDSGGPALTETPTGWQLTGVTSGGGRNVDTGERISVYQDLSASLNWLHTTVISRPGAAAAAGHSRR